MTSDARSPAAGWLAIGTIAAGLLNYAYTLGLARGLTATEYSTFAAGQALILIEGVLGSAGIPWVLAQVIGRDPNDRVAARTAVTFAFWVNLLLGAALALIMGGISLTFASGPEALIVAATSFTLAASSTGLGYLQGHGRTELLAGIAVAEVIVKVAVGFILVFGSGSGAAGGLIGALVGAFIPFISFPLYMREIGAPTFRSGELGLWRSTGRISGLQVTVGVIATIDSVLVASLSATKGGAAAYQVAATLGRIPLYISTAIGTAIFPTLHRRSPRVYAQALSTYIRIALFSTIALWAVPPALIRFIFGSELGSVHHWLRFTGVLGLLIGLFNLLMTKEQAEEQSARRVLLKCSAALLYIAALVIGGATHGVAGLAVAGSASLFVTCVLLGRAPYQRRAARTALGILAGRSSLAALALCAIALLAVRQPAVWLIVMMLTGLGVLLASFPDLRPTRKKAKHLIATQRDQQ